MELPAESLPTDSVELLARVPLFARLPRNQLRSLARLCKPRDYEPGAVIIEEGAVGLGLFLVTSGQVEVFKQLGDKQVRLAVLEAGDILGELAVLDDEVRSASARALEPTLCLLITRDSFQTLLHKDPEVAWCIVPALTERIREMQQRILLEDEPALLNAGGKTSDAGSVASPSATAPDEHAGPSMLLRLLRAQYAGLMAGTAGLEGTLRMGTTFLRTLARETELNAAPAGRDVVARMPRGVVDAIVDAIKEGEKLPERVLTSLLDHLQRGRP